MRHFKSIRLYGLLFGMFLAFVFTTSQAFGVTRVVDNDGFPCAGAFSIDIQSALSASVAGDIVEVCDGAYPENVSVPEGVTLRSLNGKLVTSILGQPSATVGGAVVLVGSGTRVEGFDISCKECTNGTFAGVGNRGSSVDVGIDVIDNLIHDLRDTTVGLTVFGFDMSGIRLFNVTTVTVTGNMIRDIDNVPNPSGFTSRARGMFVSGGPRGPHRAKAEGTFTINDNMIDNITGFRAIGINVTRMDQDVPPANLIMNGNTVSNINDSAFFFGSVGYELDEIEERDDGVDVTLNTVSFVNTGFSLRNDVDLVVRGNTVSNLKVVGNTLNLLLDAVDTLGTGHDNFFCGNTLDVAGGLLVGPETFDNTFPFGNTFVSPFGVPDSPGLGGTGFVEDRNIACDTRDFVCPVFDDDDDDDDDSEGDDDDD